MIFATGLINFRCHWNLAIQSIVPCIVEVQTDIIQMSSPERRTGSEEVRGGGDEAARSQRGGGEEDPRRTAASERDCARPLFLGGVAP